MFNYDKIMVCGRATNNHPDFYPRFATTSTDIESELYVLVDHTFSQKESIKRSGNYALSIIVHPLTVQKIENLGFIPKVTLSIGIKELIKGYLTLNYRPYRK